MSWTEAEQRVRYALRAFEMCHEIDQLRIDCERWNRDHPAEPALDWDPDGLLSRIRDELAAFLHKTELSPALLATIEADAP